MSRKSLAALGAIAALAMAGCGDDGGGSGGGGGGGGGGAVADAKKIDVDSMKDAKGTGTHNAQVRRLGHEANPPQALKNVIVMVTYGSVDNRAETLPFPPAAALT